MDNFLIIISILALHYPIGLFKDTMRRYDRMKYYGKDLEYNVRNQISEGSTSIMKFRGSILAFVSSFILGNFPLNLLLGWSWYWIFILNIVISLFLAPMIAFATTPNMLIYDRSQLKTRSIIFSLIGILIYIYIRF